jgi:hypothetical protein
MLGSACQRAAQCAGRIWRHLGETHMHRLLVSAFAALLLGSLAPPAEASSSVRIKNQSNWDIYELYLSPVNDRDWGPDQLGRHVISSGETFTLTDVRCANYDVRLVDEDDDVCVVENVRLCGKETWTISDRELLACQLLTDE